MAHGISSDQRSSLARRFPMYGMTSIRLSRDDSWHLERRPSVSRETVSDVWRDERPSLARWLMASRVTSVRLSREGLLHLERRASVSRAKTRCRSSGAHSALTGYLVTSGVARGPLETGRDSSGVT